MKELNILISGVSGQGNLLVSRIIADAAFKEGLRVRTCDIYGAAQRGGPVTSHIRIGSEVYTATIPEGHINVLLALEPMEALRNAKYLAPNSLVIVNTKTIPPMDVKIGKADYPERQKVVTNLKKMSSRVIALNADAIATKIGSHLAANIVMLGALFAITNLPIGIESFEAAIRRAFPTTLEEVNVKAFKQGIREGKLSLMNTE